MGFNVIPLEQALTVSARADFRSIIGSLPYVDEALDNRAWICGGFARHMMLNRRAEFEDIHAFYSLLGLRGGIEYKMPLPMLPDPVELMFLHCNTRQHTLAFGPPAEKGINHMFFEYDRIEDVGLAHDLVKFNQVPVVIEPGSHANDQNFSFYFKNPSGFMNELGWGGRQPTGQSEYYQRDSFGHGPVMENMKGFMVPA